jgi:predicted flap endonuclease-1-like 5' DNA nuclease
MKPAPHTIALPASERLDRLLSMPGIGPSVIGRLQDVGIRSVSQLRQVGVDHAVLAVCEKTGQIAFANRRRFLHQALGQLA